LYSLKPEEEKGSINEGGGGVRNERHYIYHKETDRKCYAFQGFRQYPLAIPLRAD
jgi:hypothetical protein